jgi:hypothetical protein
MRPKLQISARSFFTSLFCIVVAFSFLAHTVTASYYVAVMPRLPQPTTGRIYRAGFPKMGEVYLNEREFAWVNLLQYDMPIACGVSIVLLAIFVVLPQARRKSRL